MEKKMSWRTTTGGIAAILIAVFSAVQMLVDGNPNTNPDWNVVVAAVAVGYGLISARDKKVTSEQAGAK